MNPKVICIKCDGYGEIEIDDNWEICPVCNGDGKIEDDTDLDDDSENFTEE